MSDKTQEDEAKTTGQSTQEPAEGAVEPGDVDQPQGQSSEQDTTSGF